MSWAVAFCLTLVLCPAQDLRHQEFLWIVTNQTAKVYLMGSIHNLRDTDYPLAPILDRAFEEATQVVFEVKLEEFDTPATLSHFLRRGLYPPGESLAQHVSADTYALIKEYEKRNNLTISDSSRPWFVAYFIRGEEARRQGQAGIGVDQFYYERAKAKNLRILALESAAFQIDLLADASPAQQEKELRELLLNIDGLSGGTDELIDFWKSGNVAAIIDAFSQIRTSNPDWFQRFLSERNSRWLPQIESYLQQNETTLVIAGAGHLVGRDSVVDLLRRKQHKVTQLPLLPSRLTAVDGLGQNGWRLGFDIIAGHNYVIEASADLARWTVIHQFVSSGSTRSHTDPSLADGRRFYRLRNLDEE